MVEHLKLRGYDAQLLVPEEEDIPLKERVRRANRISCQIGHPIQETIIISIHVNGIIDFIQHGANEPLQFHPALSLRLDTKTCRHIVFWSQYF